MKSLLKLFLSVLAFTLLSVSLASAQITNIATTQPITERGISADLQKAKGPLSTMFKTCVGAGRANEGLRADWQRQLTEVHQECGFTYLRMHGIFCDDMGVYREDKNSHPEYNWQYIDQVYDFLISIHMKPFVELGFCPAAMASGSQTVFWWKANTTQPKDPKKWHDLIQAFVAHLKERYGDKEVKTWYFEVWNEPNLSMFFAGTQQDYFNLYANTVRAIKSISPDYKVGGPATAGCAWISEFIDFCAKSAVPVDFISTHDYAVNSGYLDENGTAGTVFSPNPTSIYGNVIRIRKLIAASALPHLELHFTEWSASYTPTDPIHDSYHSAAFILDKIKNAGVSADSMSYWVFTDIFEENGPRWTPFHGGFGLINYQDIRKPAFYAYQFLNKLGPTELQNADPASYVCTDSSGGIQALIWDFTITHPGESVIDQVYYKRDLPSVVKSKVKLHVANVPDGRYIVEVYQVGYRVNDAYATYRDLGSPSQLTRAQVDRIKAGSNGAPALQETVNVRDGVFEQEFTLRENDVYLITVKKP